MLYKIISCDDSTTPDDNRHVNFIDTAGLVHKGLYVDREQVIYENANKQYDIFKEVIAYDYITDPAVIKMIDDRVRPLPIDAIRNILHEHDRVIRELLIELHFPLHNRK